MLQQTLDHHLINLPARPGLSGGARFAAEFLYFGIKEVRARLFVGLFFAALFGVPRDGMRGVPRCDALLLIMTFTIVANLKHTKQRLHVAE